MITGDHLVIAKETSRVLGMGNKIYPADGLPVLLQDGGVPSDLVEKYGENESYGWSNDKSRQVSHLERGGFVNFVKKSFFFSKSPM